MLRDTVTQRDGGGFVEVTDDWYAQDNEGNVWYLGEDTKEYKDGKVVVDHGLVGARGGRRLCRHHHARRTRGPGSTYRQEYYKGEAEDVGKVLSVDATVTVPFGTFENCVKTEDTTPLEPGRRRVQVLRARTSATCCAPPRTAAGARSWCSFTK